MVKLQVLNPVAQNAGKNKFHAAIRVPDLHGKKIGLYDNCKGGGPAAQQRIKERFSARFEGLEFLHYSGSIGARSTLTAKGAQAIAQNCDVVIGIRAD